MKLEPTSEAAKVLQVADVIMEVEGVPIAADESIPFRWADVPIHGLMYPSGCLQCFGGRSCWAHAWQGLGGCGVPAGSGRGIRDLEGAHIHSWGRALTACSS